MKNLSNRVEAKKRKTVFKATAASSPIFKSTESDCGKWIPSAKYEYIWQFRANDSRFENFEARASDVVEEIYQNYLSNRGDTDVRAVKSGDWEYQVDFLAMKQTNTQHENHRIRDVRRIPNDKTKSTQ